MQQWLIRGTKETSKHAGATEQSPESVSPAVANHRIATESRNGESDPNAPRARPSALMGGNNIFYFDLLSSTLGCILMYNKMLYKWRAFDFY